MKVGELFVQLGVVTDSKTLKEFAKTIGDLPLDVAAGIAALAGLEYHLLKIAEQAMNTAAGFDMFSAQTGLSWKELQRWQIVAEQANVSTDAVASSVTALERNLAEIKLGRGNIAPFQLLGISPNQSGFQVLDQLRQRIKGLSRPMATNLISQMGISPEMIKLLSMTNEEFSALSKTVHGMTGEQMKDFLQAKQILVQWGMAFREVMVEIVSHFTQALEKSLAFKKVIIGVGLALGALAIYFFPVTAAVVGLILVLDDLATYFSGGDSLTGRAIEGIKKLGQAIAASPLAMIGKVMNGLTSLPFGSLGMAGMPMQALAGAAGNKSVQNIFNVSVTGSGPAEGLAREVTRRIAKHLGQAEHHVNKQGF